MKFNPKSLKSFFNFIRQSPIDDMAVNAVKNNADDMAMGALNAVDDVGKLYGESMLTPKNETFIDALDDALFKSSGTSKLRNFTPLKELRPASLEEYKVDYSPLEKYFSTLKGTSNADNLANSALDIVDDIPTSISFDDIADTYTWRQTHDINKPPITPKEFVQNYKTNRDNRIYGEMMDDLFPNYSQIGDPADTPALTSPPVTNEHIKDYVDIRGEVLNDLAYRGLVPEEPPYDYLLELYDAGYKFDSTPDYESTRINPIKFGQSRDPIDFLLYPDGFENPDDFARYHDNLEQGFISSDKPAYTYPVKLSGVQNRYYSPTRTRRTLNELQPEFDPYTDNREHPTLIDMYMRLLNSKS